MQESSEKQTVERYFRAMQAGQAGEEELLALFTDDAVYIEPFTNNGRPSTHDGKPAIRAWLANEGRMRPDDMELTVDRIDMEHGRLRAEWTCTSAAFPGPMRGRDVYELRDGKIARLETTMFNPEQHPSS